MTETDDARHVRGSQASRTELLGLTDHIHFLLFSRFGCGQLFPQGLQHRLASISRLDLQDLCKRILLLPENTRLLKRFDLFSSIGNKSHICWTNPFVDYMLERVVIISGVLFSLLCPSDKNNTKLSITDSNCSQRIWQIFVSFVHLFIFFACLYLHASYHKINYELSYGHF